MINRDGRGCSRIGCSRCCSISLYRIFHPTSLSPGQRWQQRGHCSRSFNCCCYGTCAIACSRPSASSLVTDARLTWAFTADPQITVTADRRIYQCKWIPVNTNRESVWMRSSTFTASQRHLLSCSTHAELLAWDSVARLDSFRCGTRRPWWWSEFVSAPVSKQRPVIHLYVLHFYIEGWKYKECDWNGADHAADVRLIERFNQ